MRVIIIGVAIGQRRKPTALCVVEQDQREPKGKAGLHHVVRYATRFPPATPYPVIAERLGQILSKLARDPEISVSVFVDVTGLGEPVVEILQEKAAGVRITPCYFTHGDQLGKEDRGVRIGKGHLVAKLQTLLQSNRLRLPKTVEAETMARELMDYEIRVEADANERYGAFTVGTQDDLVTALGLAVSQKPRRRFAVL